jgi:Leucine-rich repeat (LRR) protein
MSKTKKNAKSGITFKQGLQLFFVRKILDDRYTMGSEANSKRGIAFFSQWSGIVCKGRKKDENFPCSIKVPEGFGKGLEVEGESKAFRGVEGKRIPLRVEKGRRIVDISFVPEKYREEYRPLLQNRRSISLFHLLGDEDLGELMRIAYPTEAEAAEIAAVVGTSKDEDIIREAIARQLGKKPDELTEDDYSKIKELDLSFSEISDLEPINGIRSLQWINLNNTKVIDLEPIKGLRSLKELYLNDTQVSNLEPIKGLSSLQWLYINNTQVSDLEPIKGLGNLQELALIRTHVSDLAPIKGLSSLKELYLSGTKVSDLEPIKGLSGLKRLHLSYTKIRDLEPIKGLSSLQGLSLRGTKVTKKQVNELQKELPELTIVR